MLTLDNLTSQWQAIHRAPGRVRGATDHRLCTVISGRVQAATIANSLVQKVVNKLALHCIVCPNNSDWQHSLRSHTWQAGVVNKVGGKPLRNSCEGRLCLRRLVSEHRHCQAEPPGVHCADTSIGRQHIASLWQGAGIQQMHILHRVCAATALLQDSHNLVVDLSKDRRALLTCL